MVPVVNVKCSNLLQAFVVVIGVKFPYSCLHANNIT